MTSLSVPNLKPPVVVYPETDGEPMAESTLQWRWIVRITGGLLSLFEHDPNVFVGGNLFWYPVEGRPDIRLAPDTMVAFGRPPGDRGSYRQWEEGGVAPQVVFEVLSPGNRFGEMSKKFGFYQRYGVEEYYIVNPDPEHLELSGFLRRDANLVEVPEMHQHVSPRLGIRFEIGQEIRLIRPDGKPLQSYEETAAEAQRANQEAQRANQEAQRLRERLRALGDTSV